MKDVKRTTQISSNIGRGCEHCDHWIGTSGASQGDVSDSINHYIEVHGYHLLHVGTEPVTVQTMAKRGTTPSRFSGTTIRPHSNRTSK